MKVLEDPPHHELRLVNAGVEGLRSAAFDPIEVKGAQRDGQLYCLVVVEFHYGVVMAFQSD